MSGADLEHAKSIITEDAINYGWCSAQMDLAAWIEDQVEGAA